MGSRSSIMRFNKARTQRIAAGQLSAESRLALLDVGGKAQAREESARLCNGVQVTSCPPMKHRDWVPVGKGGAVVGGNSRDKPARITGSRIVWSLDIRSRLIKK